MTAANAFLWGWKGRRRKSLGGGYGSALRVVAGGVDGISEVEKVTMTDF